MSFQDGIPGSRSQRDRENSYLFGSQRAGGWKDTVFSNDRHLGVIAGSRSQRDLRMPRITVENLTGGKKKLLKRQTLESGVKYDR